MKSNMGNVGWCHAGTLRAIAALTFAALSTLPTAALAVPASGTIYVKQNEVVATIGTLKRSQQRWIEIDLSEQRLIGWEGSTEAFAVTVSTGKPSTPTPTGVFAIQSKHASTRMRGEDYNVPYVPYTMYFSGGYAIHGAYWHNRFGTPISHGCVNVSVDRAQTIFDWASVGTPVVVHQ